ncbi:MAG TPA: serine/threonine dehydratase [Acidimicrobiia bacterium]
MLDEGPLLSKADVEAAATRIAAHVRRTPTITLEEGAFGLPNPIVLKLESQQESGSFKARGAFSLLTTSDLSGGVVAASGGNFGLAIGYAARMLGAKADVFVPDSVPPAKLSRIRAEGAIVHVVPGYYPDALAASHDFARDCSGLFAHAYDQVPVAAGQGTCGLELLDQCQEVETIVTAVGGGGLLSGLLAACDDQARVIGVESEGCGSLNAALQAGAPVDIEVSGLAASALGASRVGTIAWSLRDRIGDSLVVSDDDLVAAQRGLWEAARVAAEPAAAAPLAALMSGAYVPAAGEVVALIVSGANFDPTDLRLLD